MRIPTTIEDSMQRRESIGSPFGIQNSLPKMKTFEALPLIKKK
jgi:hypothetical protein